MLPEIRVASPCTADWEKMAGDERVRHCAECNLDVYDFSEMTEREIERLIARSRGQRLCGRLYRRADGTLLTRDCPVGLRTRVKRISRRVGMALAAAMSVGVTAAQSTETRDTSLVQIQQQSGIELVVRDHSDAVIPHAKVHIASMDKKEEFDGATDAVGQFSLALSPGSYVLTVRSVGFVTSESTFTIPSHGKAAADVSLKVNLDVGSMGEVVVVEVPQIEPSENAVPEFLPEPSIPAAPANQTTTVQKHPSALKRFFSRLGRKTQ